MENHQSMFINRNSRKTRFVFRFVRALARIKMSKQPQQQQQHQRCTTTTRRIKLAADASMATTIGSRRAWSRAMLFKLRNQAKKRALVRKVQVVVNKKKKENKKMKNKNKKKKKIVFSDDNKNYSSTSVRRDDDHEAPMNRANKLRRLVPGGEAMDFCSLLEETAHYIKCLNTQVQVMKSIADIYTS